MSKAQTISKLEALLDRVRARAGEPRVLALPVAEEVEDLESTDRKSVV